jgi:hypothetical protein
MKPLRTGALLLGLAAAFTSAADAQANVSGSWITHSFGEPNLFVLQVSGRTVTGTINRPQDVMDITNGVIDGSTITLGLTRGSGREEDQRVLVERRIRWPQVGRRLRVGCGYVDDRDTQIG